MNPVVKKYFELPKDQQKRIQIFLCEKALSVWEKEITTNRSYTESVTGTIQQLDHHLPREAFDSVICEADHYSVRERYQEPICALQDEDLVLPEPALSAYYAIYNLFVSSFINRSMDTWVIVNQALASLGPENAIDNLDKAINTEH